MINAAPGWYPVEGDHRRRYWDGQAWTDHYEQTPVTPPVVTPAGPTPTTTTLPVAPALSTTMPRKNRMSTMKKALIGVGAAVVLIGVVGAALGDDGQAPSVATTSSTTTSATKGSTPSPKTLSAETANGLLASYRQPKDPCKPTAAERETFMNELTSNESADVAAIHVDAFLGTACEDAQKKAAEAKAAAASAAAAAKAKAARVNPKTYAAIDKRALAKLIKNPDAYTGNKYVIFAEVTQFDSITGGERFRADVAHKDIREYGVWIGGENSFVDAGAADLSEVVNGDIVKMYVTVKGTESYETTMGGTLTVPVFETNILKVIGSAD